MSLGDKSWFFFLLHVPVSSAESERSFRSRDSKNYFASPATIISLNQIIAIFSFKIIIEVHKSNNFTI